MGWRLVQEVLDHYHGAARHKLWLVSFALSASDQTRVGWPPRWQLAHRSGVTPVNASHIASRLVRESVIKRDGGGYHGSPARYIILPLAEGQRVSPQTPFKGVTTDTLSKPKGVTTDTLKGVTSEQKGVIPSPLPAETSPPLVKSSHISSQKAGHASGAPTAQTILAAFIDWDHGNGGELTKRTIGQLAKHIDQLLAEGISGKHIKRGLADWRAKGCHPSALHSFVDAAMNGRVSGRSTTDDRVAQAQALKRQLTQHPEWPS